MKVAIIGSGYVGLTTGACLAKLRHMVTCVDIDEKKIEALKNGVCPVYEPGLTEIIQEGLREKKLFFTTDTAEAIRSNDIIFICVNTPPRPDGQADLRFVENVAREIAQNLNGYKVIVDKSTVPVRTAERVKETILKYSTQKIDFDVVSNPEFLREGSALQDTMEPDRIVIGVESEKAKDAMLKLYQPLLSQVSIPVKITSVKSAELIKHGANSFLATKISFANLIASLADEIGADAKDILEAIGLDRRIGRDFLQPGIGFGGSCFPKDLAAFKKTIEILGLPPNLIQAVEDINADAIQRFVKKIERELWVLDKKKITILGLAFKPNTDDIRNSPALKIIEHLARDGAQLTVHDPQAMKKVSMVMPQLIFATSAYDALNGSEALVLCTEWPEYSALDFSEMKKRMSTHIIFDGRNALNSENARKHGFRYFGVGRP